MFVYQQLLKKAHNNAPIRVGVIGAGKFSSMFFSQVRTTPGLEISSICDLNVEQAKRNCLTAGWTEEHCNATQYTDSVDALLNNTDIDVVVEATGNPVAGVKHAFNAIEQGKHVVMVNVEADVLAGALLAEKAKAAGLVYSMAYGDQPALTCELVEWARCCGFHVVAAGKGTKYLPEYHYATPDTVWDHYGLTQEQARQAGMNSQMFNSFLDGTKSALEMAAISNATGLAAPEDGLQFLPAGTDDLAHVLRPKSDGGLLNNSGQVEVVSSLERDGRPVYKDLRWGVYVVLQAQNQYAADCFVQYGMNTDSTGRYSAMYKPFHLIGLELGMSILSAAILNTPTGSTMAFNADVAATAKRNLKAGEILDGEGGYTVWGKCIPSMSSLTDGCLPIGLAHGVAMKRDVPKDSVIRWSDVAIDKSDFTVALRLKMENEARAHLEKGVL